MIYHEDDTIKDEKMKKEESVVMRCLKRTRYNDNTGDDAASETPA